MDPREYRVLSEVEDSHWWFLGLRRDIARAFARTVRREREFPARWLDAGSGTGGLLANLDVPEATLRVGLDESLHGLLPARSRRLSRLAQGSADALPFASSSFDAVTSIDVLCHRDVVKKAAVSEAYRCLSPGGVFVVQVPAFDWLRSGHDEAVWTDRRFHRREVEALLAEAGFQLRDSFYRLGFLFPAAAVRRLAGRLRRKSEPRSDVAPVPRWLNRLLGGLLRLESALTAAGLRLPFGLSVFCVGVKADSPGVVT